MTAGHIDCKLDFERLASGVVVDDEYLDIGVSISSSDPSKPPMVFDTARPTGGDTDLATDNLGHVLIISEDGDSCDPDDNAAGGKLFFDFADDVVMQSITVLDVEECVTIRLFDDHGDLLFETTRGTADNGQAVIDLGGTPGVARMEVELYGSGAIDNVCFRAPEPEDTATIIARDDVAETDEDTAVVIDVLANDSLLGDDDEDDEDEGDEDDEDHEDEGEGDDEDEEDDEEDEEDDEDDNDEEDDEDNDDEEDDEDEDGEDDEDDLSLRIVAASSPDGTVTINLDGTLTFLPNPDFNGETTITYTVAADDGDDEEDDETATATVRVTVNPVNDAPLAVDGADATDEDTAVTVDLLANDSDVDGDPLTVTAASVAAGQGSLTDNGDGTVTFTPAPDFNGTATISYTVSDGQGGTANAQHVITVRPVNDAPVANPDSDTTPFNTAITVDLIANDSDVDGDPLTVTAASVPAGQGSLTDNGDGTVTFTPAPGFSGTATIAYTIRDPGGLTASSTHSVVVAAPALNGIVEGTAGDDLIDGGYRGDPEGDRVDHEDAILPGAAPNDDLIYGFDGDDTIFGGQGDDEVWGGDGDDSILGQAGSDTLLGNAGNDYILGGRDGDLIRGGDDDDTVDGAAGNDTVFGGDGDDLVIGGGGDDLLDGGRGDDTILGNNNADTISGGAGDDSIDAGASADIVTGGTGSDTILGGDGDDTINAGNHDDPLPDVGYPGLYPADADPGNDRDFVDGGNGDDIIATGDDDDTILGGTGNDRIDAGFDDDLVDGGTGDDTIIGGEGNDTVDGGDGNDLIYGGLDDSFPDIVNIPDDGSGPFGPDLVDFNNNDSLSGGAGNDTIYGRDDDDTLEGGTGDDLLDGGVDDDLIDGGDGDDTIVGGQGMDTMTGGLGSDLFLGGNGGDAVFGGEDPDLDGDGRSDETDVLDLTGAGVDFITYTSADREDGIVTFLDGSTMTFEEIETVVPCFTPGTMIATPRGERPVEDLREGDRIITRDNGLQEIRWVGRKEMSGRDLVRNPHLRPILIRAGALGNGLPERDMLVSPNHRVLVANDKTQLYFEETEVLAAAKHLVGAGGIHAVDMMAATYIHFMFDKHEVVLSNGAWTESFQPGDYSLKGMGNSQRLEIFELFPELKDRKGLAGYSSARKALKKHEAKLLVN